MTLVFGNQYLVIHKRFRHLEPACLWRGFIGKSTIGPILLFLASLSTSAQEVTTSPYSFYGIGVQNFKGSAENRFMGGLGMYSDSIRFNMLNPAGLADLRLVNFTVGATYEYNDTETRQSAGDASRTMINYLAIGLPVGEKLGVGFGLVPKTSVGYATTSQTEDGTMDNMGKGGLNKVFLSAGYQLATGLNIGAEGGFNFGEIENTAYAIPNDTEFLTRETNTSSLSGFTLNFGLTYRNKLAKNTDWFSSVTWSPETSLTSENTRVVDIIHSQTGQIPQSIEVPLQSTYFSSPQQFTFGLGVGDDRHWFVGAEYTRQQSSVMTNRSFSLENITFTDADHYRIGGFIVPDYRPGQSYWKRISYRAGFRYEETGLNINGEDIDEFGISFGVSLPAGRMFSNLNAGFEYGQRGTVQAGLTSENFVSIMLSLSFNDRWFQRRLYD